MRRNYVRNALKIAVISYKVITVEKAQEKPGHKTCRLVGTFVDPLNPYRFANEFSYFEEKKQTVQLWP